MINSTKKRINPFSWLFKQNLQFFLAFIIPFGILLLAYICFGVYPVGNRSVLSLDLNGQYVYYFDYMYDVFAGRESLFYSWSRSLSGEFMGVIGYYLASPFNFLVWIFPRHQITEGLLVMLVTKAGAIGLCMSWYLSRGRGMSKGTTVIFSMMYALCSYTIVQTMNPMWLDGVMALPLVFYGIESLIRYGRFRMLAVSLIYSFVTCFYIGYMIGIFAAIYFVYYFFACDNFGRLEKSGVMARIGLFFISSITAVMCSAFMILPVYNSLSLGKFDFSIPDFSVRSNFNLISLINKFLPNSYDTVRMEGLPFLYCGILTVLMLVCYFIGGKSNRLKYKSISSRKRIAGAVLLLFMTVCMYIAPVDMLWHGGQLPNWLPYRYSFIISLLIVSWSAEAFERISGYPKKLIGGAAAGFFGVMVLLENMDNFNSSLGKDGRDTLDGITVILPAVLILLIISIIVIKRRDRLEKNKAGNAFIITLGVVVGIELFYNTLMGVVKQDIDIVYSSRDSYLNVIEPTREVVQEILDKELANDKNAIFRIEKDYFRTVNDPLALNMYGLSHSSSTLNFRPIELLGKLGLTSRSHYTRYSGATPIIDDLFGIKYILSTEENDSGKITGKSDISVEENADAMPLAYLVDAGFRYFDIEGDYEKKLNVFALQNSLLSSMLGLQEKENDYLKMLDMDGIEIETENVKYGTASGGHTSYKIETAGKNAQVKYYLTAEKDGEMFLWMPTDYERKLNIWVNNTELVTEEITVDGNTEISESLINVDIWKGNFFETDNYCVKSLGNFKEGEEFSVTMTLTKDDLYFKDVFFAYMDWDVYLPAIQALHEMNTNTKVEKISSTNLKIHVNADEERLLFTTIPVEPGWKVTLDGKDIIYTEIFGTGEDDDSGALIGINVPSGEHVVEMKFTTGYYPLALYITGGGIVLLTLMFVFSWRLNKIRRAANSGQEYDDEFNFDDEYENQDQDEDEDEDNNNDNEDENNNEDVSENGKDDFVEQKNVNESGNADYLYNESNEVITVVHNNNYKQKGIALGFTSQNNAENVDLSDTNSNNKFSETDFKENEAVEENSAEVEFTEIEAAEESSAEAESIEIEVAEDSSAEVDFTEIEVAEENSAEINATFDESLYKEDGDTEGFADGDKYAYDTETPLASTGINNTQDENELSFARDISSIGYNDNDSENAVDGFDFVDISVEEDLQISSEEKSIVANTGIKEFENESAFEVHTKYDREAVDRSLSLILNELDEINQLDDEEEPEIEINDLTYSEHNFEQNVMKNKAENIDIYNDNALSADDLFPDEEIRRL